MIRIPVPATKSIPLIALCLLALAGSMAYASTREISRDVPGSVTINLVPIEASLDLDGSGIVDRADLQVIAGKLGQTVGPGDRGDINNDGRIDVRDLAVGGLYLGKGVPA